MRVEHKQSRKCLRVRPAHDVDLGFCGEEGTGWYATGKNGWVKFISNTLPYRLCLRPDRTWEAGRSWYPLVVDWCDPNNHLADPTDINGNVPNILAWRWHA